MSIFTLSGPGKEGGGDKLAFETTCRVGRIAIVLIEVYNVLVIVLPCCLFLGVALKEGLAVC